MENLMKLVSFTAQVDTGKLSDEDRLKLLGGEHYLALTREYKVTTKVVLELYKTGLSYDATESFCGTMTRCGITNEEALAFIYINRSRMPK